VLKDDCDRKMKVLGVCGQVYVMSAKDCFDVGGGIWTKEDLEGRDYKLYTDKDEEMTVAEVCEELGRDVKIIKD